MKTLATLASLTFAITVHGLDVVTSHPAASDFSAGGSSSLPLFSADSRYLLFLSDARNLVTNALNPRSVNLFRRELPSGETLLVSHSPFGPGANSSATAPSISSNGNLVAFVSTTDLLPGGIPSDPAVTNVWREIFVRDINGKVLIPVSVDVSGHRQPQVSNDNPMISSEGRYVVFESDGTNLTAETKITSAVDIYRRDIWSNTTVAVTHNGTNAPAVKPRTSLAAITPDGNRIAFITDYTNIAAEVSASSGDLYIDDLQSGEIFWAQPPAGYFTATYRCISAAFSANGAYAAMIVSSDDHPLSLFRHDLQNHTSVLIASPVASGSEAFISSNGRYIAFEDGTNVYRWDASAGAATVVNLNTNGVSPVSGVARHPRMSADGSRIAFVSNSPDISAPGSNGVFQLYARDMNAGVTSLVTATPANGPSAGSSEVSLFDIAPNLGAIAFDSAANDLVAGDENGLRDVFVRNLSTGTTTLVSSRNAAYPPRRTANADAYITASSISDDGRFIALASADSNLVPNDTNHVPDVFLADVSAGTMMSAGFQTNPARGFVLSSDGRYLTHFRYSYPSTGDLYRFDAVNQTTQFLTNFYLVLLDQFVPSVSRDGQVLVVREPGNNGRVNVVNTTSGATEFSFNTSLTVISRDTFLAVFSPDSRFVLYANSSSQLSAYDRQSHDVQILGGRSALSISGNSRFVAFTNVMSGTNALCRYDLLLRTNQVVGAPLGNPAITHDGRFIVGETVDFGPPQILMVDCTSGATTLLSATRTGERANKRSTAPTVSRDGRYVSFLSEATDIIEGHTNGLRSVILRDLLLGTTKLVSASASGVDANATCTKPVFSGDGRTLVFSSMADNLVAGDYNDRRDVFAVKLAVDSDGDGLDDDWEIAYFGNLSRDGSGDFDGDGVSDRAEFLAGTDPTNNGSVFRVMTLTRIGGNGRQVVWTGNPSGAYRLEYKDDLTSSTWTPLDTTISWSGSMATAADPTPASTRFYRVVRLP